MNLCLYKNILIQLEREKSEDISLSSYENIKELLAEAIINLENKNYFLALKILIKIYEIQKFNCILNFIYKSYVYPNEEYYLENLERNLILFEKYKYYYGNNITISKWDKFTFDIIWINKQYLVLFDGNKFIQEDFYDRNIPISEDDVLLGLNVLSYNEIIKYDKEILIMQRDMYKGMKQPIYLYYDKEYFEVLLRIIDFSEILAKKRFIILCERKNLEKFFLDFQAIMPTKINDIRIKEILNDILNKKQIKLENARKGNKDYYNRNYNLIIDNIKNKKPKILFLTSLFTTALQYHAKNMEKAARKAGYTTDLLIEKSEFHRAFISDEIIINEFKPDIIFLIDHFRFENDMFDKSIIFISWIQDPLSNIMDKQTPLKLTNRDFILNHYISWDKFFEIGYDKTHIIEGPVPANQDIYKEYDLTEEEKKEYSCDICILCHTKPISDYINNGVYYIKGIEDKLKEIFYSYWKLVCNNDNMIFYHLQEYKDFIKYSLSTFYSIKMSDKVIDDYAKCMYYELNSLVFRHCLVDWLIEAGYTNIKLWGNGWTEEEKYRPYAMGAAENGEKLSKIYQCSKIVLGNNIMTTGAARAWESMLSGAFFLCNWIPPDEDGVDIRKILDPEDFVMFKGKEDLLQKVNYYLTNEEERQKMIKRGKKAALEKMTFDATFERMMKVIREQL